MQGNEHEWFGSKTGFKPGDLVRAESDDMVWRSEDVEDMSTVGRMKRNDLVLILSTHLSGFYFVLHDQRMGFIYRYTVRSL